MYKKKANVNPGLSYDNSEPVFAERIRACKAVKIIKPAKCAKILQLLLKERTSEDPLANARII